MCLTPALADYICSFQRFCGIPVLLYIIKSDGQINLAVHEYLLLDKNLRSVSKSKFVRQTHNYWFFFPLDKQFTHLHVNHLQDPYFPVSRLFLSQRSSIKLKSDWMSSTTEQYLPAKNFNFMDAMITISN